MYLNITSIISYFCPTKRLTLTLDVFKYSSFIEVIALPLGLTLTLDVFKLKTIYTYW